MTHFLLACLCHIVIDIIRMCLHLINLLLRNVKTKLFLRLCKGNPQFSPGTEFHIL